MDEKTLLQYSKELTLNYLKEINADVKEQDGIYYVTLPLKVSKLFGGETKRITFSPDVAATHSYELVVPGSNFLSVVLREAQKQAPVVVGSIPKNEQNMQKSLEKIDSHNCEISLYEYIESKKLGTRFYFHINLRSIKNSSSIRWADVELDSLQTLEFPFNLDFDEGKLELQQNDKRFDDAYSKSIEEFEKEIQPQVEKYVDLTEQDKRGEIVLLDAQEQKRLQEIKYDLNNERGKLKEFDRKISRAKSTDTMRRHAEDKAKFEKKLAKIEEQASKQIQRIANDKKISLTSIEQKYKPILEFSLLAAQIYSYNVVDCIFTVKKENLEKQIKGQYVDPSSKFIINCNRCKSHAEGIHLCENSHVTCDNCIRNCLNCTKEFCLNCEIELNPCYICKDGLCNDCSKNCEFCSEVTCFSHAMNCEHCTKFLCYFCSEKCIICSKKFCQMGVKRCDSCQNLACEEDLEKCGICSKNFCVNHQEKCGICLKFHCKSDTKTCKICKCEYSSDCVSKDQCATCSHLKSTDRQDSQVKALITKYPQYQKHKKWEVGVNTKYVIFKAKKFLGSKIIIAKKDTLEIVRGD